VPRCRLVPRYRLVRQYHPWVRQYHPWMRHYRWVAFAA
jgi:hypothetical protein